MLSVSPVEKSGLNEIHFHLLYRCQARFCLRNEVSEAKQLGTKLSVLLAERLQVLLMKRPEVKCRRCGREVTRGLKPHRCRKTSTEVIPPGQQLNLEGCTCKTKTLDGRRYVYCRCE